MARYFVTGATGFIGGQVARQLAHAGHQVVALVRSTHRATALKALDVELAEGDVTDQSSLRTAMQHAQGVFHLAGWYQVGVRDKSPGQRISVDGTRNVLDVMRELNIPKGVYTSTVAVFGDTHGRLMDETYHTHGPWLSEYDRTKWVAHYEVADPMMRAGLPLVIVQPGVVYGPGDTSAMGDTLRAYLRRRLPMIPKGAAYCWGHVEDTARGHIQAMERGRPGEAYIIAGPPHSLAEALAIAESITGVPRPRMSIPPGALRGAAALLGVLRDGARVAHAQHQCAELGVARHDAIDGVADRVRVAVHHQEHGNRDRARGASRQPCSPAVQPCRPRRAQSPAAGKSPTCQAPVISLAPRS